MGRFTFFLIVTICSFVYYTLPGFVFTIVSTILASTRVCYYTFPDPVFSAVSIILHTKTLLDPIRLCLTQ